MSTAIGGTNTGDQPITNYYAPSAANQAAVDNAFLSEFGIPQTSSSVSTISGSSMQNFLDNQFASLFQGTNWSSNWSSASSQPLTNQISETQTADTSVSANNTAFQQLAQVYTMVADLGTQNLNPSAYQAVTSTAQSLLSSAISNLVSLQANVGLVQSNISTATNQMSAQMNILSTQIGNLENVNPYEVATRVNNLQTQIETAYSLTFNGAVLRVDRKVSLELLNDATFLLEAHVMKAEDATTPLRQLYFIIQIMLMNPNDSGQARAMCESAIRMTIAASDNAGSQPVCVRFNRSSTAIALSKRSRLSGRCFQ